MGRIVIDPVTRIEGHLKIEVVTEGGVVREARCSGLLFRGLEVILRGRDPRDASVITQRICGVCPIAHAMASSLALDDAFHVAAVVPHNGRLLRNLILGSNYIQSHILHFYHLAALDYVDATAAAGYAGHDRNLRLVAQYLSGGGYSPFLPRYEGDYRLSKELNEACVSHYVEALHKRREAHEMLAIFGGKMPHQMSIFPGGALERVTVDKIMAYRHRLERLRDFIDNVYLPDVLAVAAAYPDHAEIGAGCRRYLSYGAWDMDQAADLTQRRRYLPGGVLDGQTQEVAALDPQQISEQVRYAWYKSSSNLPPARGETVADPTKPTAYSFLKAPRYGGAVCEVGPLARLLVAYSKGHERVRKLVDGVLSALNLPVAALSSVLGRHAARALECKLVADAMSEWVLQLHPGEPTCAESQVPESGRGMGLAEAPRGSVGHWIEIENGVIANYQAVVPTTWNCSPRDDNDAPGACEQALEGTRVKDEQNPFELVRIVRSFDPCLACAIHMVSPKGRELGAFRVT
ncbi:MAG: Periplasmic [NiFeSe] hydrogenase large subunit [Phycisphaerae bacterium]|nr:Periplasmic [NiFeSe] hydrogenase large subunit [Phycisphaerae bacterium]